MGSCDLTMTEWRCDQLFSQQTLSKNTRQGM